MAERIECEKEYSAAQAHPAWAGLVDLANVILHGTRRNNLQYRLDHITGGTGNCLFISVLQQLRRAQLYGLINPSVRSMVDNMQPTKLRNTVADFMLTSPVVEGMKSYHSPAGWLQLWNVVNRDPGRDADDLFIQGVALFLEIDIFLTSPAHTAARPYQTFSGNQVDRNSLTGGPHIVIGYLALNGRDGKLTGHYQSILPAGEPLMPLTRQSGLISNQVSFSKGFQAPVSEKDFPSLPPPSSPNKKTSPVVPPKKPSVPLPVPATSQVKKVDSFQAPVSVKKSLSSSSPSPQKQKTAPLMPPKKQPQPAAVRPKPVPLVPPMTQSVPSKVQAPAGQVKLVNRFQALDSERRKRFHHHLHQALRHRTSHLRSLLRDRLQVR